MKTIICFLLIFGFIIPASARINPDSLYFAQNYSKAEYRIPMRDGVYLYTVVYSPRDVSVPYPILLNRTPYNVAPYGDEMGFSFRRGLSPAFLYEGYIFVFQDVRGRFMSEGTFQHMTPYIAVKKDKTQTDENSDTWDTIEWLLKNLKNHNGNVGMWGISYPGFYASCAAIDAHPALKCVSPQAPIGDWFFDDMHHHGAFFLAANLDFLSIMDLPRHGLSKEWTDPFAFNPPDGYKFFLNLEPLGKVQERYFGDSIYFWNILEQHPNYDAFWQERNILPHLKNIRPAVLVTGGWYDAEDLYGTFKTYQAIEKNNPGIINRLVVGPWIHGGWARTDGSSLGNVSFYIKASMFYRDGIELPFFNYYLKHKGHEDLTEAYMFMTGKNEWQNYKQWPPAQTKKQKLYLGADHKLLPTAVAANDAGYDEFISDPSKPVPYTEEKVFGMTKEYMTDDQRFASRRPDVLAYESGVLPENLVLAGPLLAQLFVSTTGSDADWIVKIIDVYPDDAPDNPVTRKGQRMGGYQQMVRSEVIRGRFRNSYEHPEPMTPGKIETIQLELQDVLHCFKKGHKLMIQIQCTWFPLVDINPQHYVDNIFHAKEPDFIKATQRIYRNENTASYIEIGILNGI